MIKIRKFFVTAAVIGVGAFGLAGTASAAGAHESRDSRIAAKTTIVQVAADANAATGAFTYLLAAVGCLNESDRDAVLDALSGDDPLTLLAPTDAAFVALQTALGIESPAPEKTCALGPATVANVLTYHVMPGRRFIGSIGGLFNNYSPKQFRMLNTSHIATNPDLTITDVAGQSVGVVPGFVNIRASNGVIHVVDTVLLPFTP